MMMRDGRKERFARLKSALKRNLSIELFSFMLAVDAERYVTTDDSWRLAEDLSLFKSWRGFARSQSKLMNRVVQRYRIILKNICMDLSSYIYIYIYIYIFISILSILS